MELEQNRIYTSIVGEVRYLGTQSVEYRAGWLLFRKVTDGVKVLLRPKNLTAFLSTRRGEK